VVPNQNLHTHPVQRLVQKKRWPPPKPEEHVKKSRHQQTLQRLLVKKVKFKTKPDFKFLSIFIIPILVEMLSRKRTAQLEELSAPKHAKSAAIPPAGASPPGGSASANKKSTRREELLKQLKAVEDAIKRKRSKISS
jgi:hypothetical protein